MMRKPSQRKSQITSSGGRHFGKGRPSSNGQRKIEQEAGLEQLRLPTIAIPNLSDVNDGHIHRPEKGEQNRVRVTAEHNEREAETDPGKNR